MFSRCASVALSCMWTGFVLTVMFYLLPDSEGDLLERVLPFVVALAVAAGLSQRRRAVRPHPG